MLWVVLLSTQNICLKLWVRKYLQFYAETFCLSVKAPTQNPHTEQQCIDINRITALQQTADWPIFRRRFCCC